MTSSPYDGQIPPDAHRSYLQYFKNQLQFGPKTLDLQTLTRILAVLPSNLTKPKGDLSNWISHHVPLDSSIDVTAALEFAFRVWLMVNVNSLPTSHRSASSTALQWPDDEPILELLVEHIQQQPGSVVSSRRVVSRDLNLYDMTRIAGFEVQWTDNLMDHLSLHNRGRVIRVFPHVSVLKVLRDSQATNPKFSAFIEESLRTIALLFPHVYNDGRVRNRKQRRAIWMLGKRDFAEHADILEESLFQLPTASRRVEDYVFWRDRLLYVQEVFDACEPLTLSQWWHDDRHRVQWSTFWTAILILILTIFFGMIQSVASIVQAWASVKSLQLQRRG